MFDPERGYPSVVPYVRYADPASAARWLADVAGAREAVCARSPDGRVAHLEMVLGRSVFEIGLGAAGSGRPVPTRREEVDAMTVLFVDDVDAAVERALAGGGTVVEPPTDHPWGLRQAMVVDPGGHVWELSHHIRDVPPSEWGAEQVSELPGITVR